MVFLQYWCSKPSPLPFYPCHFSFQPYQWFHLASCIQLEYLILGPLTFKHLCRSVMFSFSFLPKLLSPSILPKCIIMLPLSSFSLWSRSFYPHLPTFLYAKQVSWHHSNTPLQLFLETFSGRLTAWFASPQSSAEVFCLFPWTFDQGPAQKLNRLQLNNERKTAVTWNSVQRTKVAEMFPFVLGPATNLHVKL